MAATIFDDKFIWRNYLDRMVNTLEHSPILQSDYPARAGQFAQDLRCIDPIDFEHEIHQRKVREVVLFIQGVLRPAEFAPRLKGLPENMRFPEPTPVPIQQEQVKPPPLKAPVMSSTGPNSNSGKKRNRKRNRRNRNKKRKGRRR